MSGILETLDGGVTTVTLHQPERGNALSASLVRATMAAVERAGANPDVHTLVLRGAGKHFCTGFDLSTLDAETDDSLLARFVRIEMLLAAIWSSPVRTMAVAQGRVVGAGADLFAACDVRVLAPDASLRFPGAGFGLVLGTGRLAQRVGASQAFDWVTTGRVIPASEALATGLATSVGESSTVDVPGVDRATWAALRVVSRLDRRDSDLAALVRSACAPGLKQRIEAHRDRALAARSRSVGHRPEKPRQSPQLPSDAIFGSAL